MTLIPHELAMKAIAVDNDKRSTKETQREIQKGTTWEKEGAVNTLPQNKNKLKIMLIKSLPTFKFSLVLIK